MAWTSSDRRSQLPGNWGSITRRILNRDGHRCRWMVYDPDTETRSRCTAKATDVDHRFRSDDHRDSNLQSLCPEHHKLKTAIESGIARKKQRAEVAKRFRREPEKHPGRLK